MIDIEEWRDIVGYGGIYQVSSRGAVRSLRYMRYLNIRNNTHGRPQVQLFKDGLGKSYLVHRLVAYAFLGYPPDPTMQVNHKDCDKTNNTPTNLEWVTASENQKHAVNNGLVDFAIGERHGMVLLTEDEVLEIRARYVPRKVSQYLLAGEYGVSRGTICDIIRGMTWRHLL